VSGSMAWLPSVVPVVADNAGARSTVTVATSSAREGAMSSP
jgi:hypothetical protein